MIEFVIKVMSPKEFGIQYIQTRKYWLRKKRKGKKMKKIELLILLLAFYITPIPTSAEEYSLEDQIADEELFGDLELLAQLCQAEAGNQDLLGMRYVADVVLNRVDDPRFPSDTIEGIIFQDYQFSCIFDGGFDNAGWEISEEAYEAAYLEMFGDARLDSGIVYFSNSEDPINGVNGWKYKDHWFSY